MITKEMIESNDSLKELSEDQIAAITGLSQKDEEIVIGKREQEIHGSYAKDVQEHLGIEKPKDKDYIDWFRSDVLRKAKSASELNTQLKAAQEEVTSLKKQIEDGSGDATLKQELKDAKDLVKTLEGKVKETEDEWKTKATDAEKENIQFQVDKQLAEDLRDVSFKDQKLVPKSVQDMVITNALTKVLSQVQTSVEKVDGKKVIVYRNTDGTMLRNADLTPKTIGQLLLAEQAVKDIMETDVSQGGTGSKPDGGGGSVGGGGATVAVDLNGAKTQVQAERLIRKQLTAKGLFPGDDDYQEEKNKIWKDNNISNLPEA